MRDVRRASALGLVALLAGCECQSRETTLRPVVVEPVVEAPSDEGAITLPRTPRADLPAATATLVVEVHPRGYRVSNRALVDSWPPPERERAAANAPPTEPEFPVVEASIPTTDPAPLLSTGLRDAMARAAAADRARDPAAGAPIAFSIRAPSDARWERILRALFAAGMAGYAEPWLLVVDDANTERALRIPSSHTPMDDTRASIRDALSALGTHPPGAGAAEVEAPSDGAPSALPALSFRLEDHGLRVRSGLVDLSADCRTPSVDASPAFTTATLDRASLEACLSALGPFDHATFEAAPEVAYGSALMILSTLHAQGRPLSIAMRGNERGR